MGSHVGQIKSVIFGFTCLGERNMRAKSFIPMMKSEYLIIKSRIQEKLRIQIQEAELTDKFFSVEETHEYKI